MKTHTENKPIAFPTDAEVDEELKKHFRQQAQVKAAAPSFDETCAAIDQLKKSERGQACLRRFVSMLKEYGFGLDTSNWQALATLHRAGAAGHQHQILDILEVSK